MPPAFAASIPAFASSTTRQFSGVSSNLDAATKNTSGSGFDFVTSSPQLILSISGNKPVFSSINGAFLLAEPTAVYLYL